MPEQDAPNPTAGGSYVRDPDTGELTRVEGPALPEPQPPAIETPEE